MGERGGASLQGPRGPAWFAHARTCHHAPQTSYRTLHRSARISYKSGPTGFPATSEERSPPWCCTVLRWLVTDSQAGNRQPGNQHRREVLFGKLRLQVRSTIRRATRSIFAPLPALCPRPRSLRHLRKARRQPRWSSRPPAAAPPPPPLRRTLDPMAQGSHMASVLGAPLDCMQCCSSCAAEALATDDRPFMYAPWRTGGQQLVLDAPRLWPLQAGGGFSTLGSTQSCAQHMSWLTSWRRWVSQPRCWARHAERHLGALSRARFLLLRRPSSIEQASPRWLCAMRCGARGIGGCTPGGAARAAYAEAVGYEGEGLPAERRQGELPNITQASASISWGRSRCALLRRHHNKR